MDINFSNLLEATEEQKDPVDAGIMNLIDQKEKLAEDDNLKIDQFLALARATSDEKQQQLNTDVPPKEVVVTEEKQNMPRMQGKKQRLNADAKTPMQVLNEMFAGLCDIRFEEQDMTGPPHEPIFRMTVHVRGEVFEGTGRSKQGAKQKAAKKAVEFFERKFGKKVPKASSSLPGPSGGDFVNIRFGPYGPHPRMHPPPPNHYPGECPWPPPPPGPHDWNGPPPFGGPSWRPHPPGFGYGAPPPPMPYGPPPPRIDFGGGDPFYGPPNVSQHRPGFGTHIPPPQDLYPNSYKGRKRPIQHLPSNKVHVPPPLVPTIPKQPKIESFADDDLDSHDLLQFDKINDTLKANEGDDKDDEDEEKLIKEKDTRVVLRLEATDGNAPEMLVNEHPISLIHELHTDCVWELAGTKMNGKIVDQFTMSLTINKKSYKGEGRTKKLARYNAARQALADLYNILVPEQFTNPSNSNEKKPLRNVLVKTDESQLLNEQLATQIGLLVLEKSKEIFAKLTNTNRWNVLSGIVLTKANNPAYMRIVCVTSGTKTIRGDSMSMNGYGLNDCHAEVLARRCFLKFLYDQISALTENGFKDTESFIVERREDSCGFRLKKDIRVHLFISSAPCGDSRVFSPKDEEVHTDPHPNRLSRGLLRAKIEGGEGTIPVKQEAAQLTWDGVSQGTQRLQFMSCSDKIAMWNVVGMQGSILSHFIEPIYLESVILGSLFNYEHFLRGVYGRLNLNFESTSLTGIPDFYKVNKVKIAKAKLPAADIQRQLSKTPSYAINWIEGDANPEIISTDVGKTWEDKGISRLAKRSFFFNFRSLLGSNAPTLPSSTLRNNIPIIYRDAKTSAQDYVQTKVKTLGAFQEQNLGHWIVLPAEFDMFSL